MQEKKFFIALKADYFQSKIQTKLQNKNIQQNQQQKKVATEPTKVTKDKSKRKISSLKLHENFLNENKNEDKNINEQIFNEFFNYHYPSFLENNLHEGNQNKIVKKEKKMNH